LPKLGWQVWRVDRKVAFLRRGSGGIDRSSIKDFEEIAA